MEERENSKATLLVVDAHPESLGRLRNFLHKHLPHCEVMTASDVAGGVFIAQNAPIDAAVVTVNIPDSGGITLCNKLKEMSGRRNQKLPVMLVASGKGNPSIISQGLDAGADDFVQFFQGTIDDREFLARVNALLKNEHSEGALQRENARLQRVVESQSQALRVSEENYRTLLDAPGQISVLITGDGTILTLNDAAAELLGREMQQCISQNLYTLLPNGLEMQLRKQVDEVLRKRTAVRFFSNQFEQDVSGCVFPVFNQSKEVSRAAIFITDISENQKIHQEAKPGDDAIRSSISAICFIDLDGKINYANPAFLKMCDYDDVKMILDKPIKDFFTTDQEILAVMNMLKEGGNWRAELTAKSRTGITLPVHVAASAVVDKAGNVNNIMISFVDISERTRIEATLRMREAILEAVSFASTHFLEESDWEPSVQAVLTHLGNATDVSRIYISENHFPKNEGSESHIRFEWTAKKIAPITDDPLYSVIPYRKSELTRWENMLSNGEVLSGHVRDLLEPERRIFEPRGVKSIVLVPIFVGPMWWGSMCYEDIKSERKWSPAELDALYTAANILGAAIQNESVQEALRSNLQFLETFLDTIPNPAFYKDASGVYHGCNAVFSQLILGLPKREILGRSIQDFPDIIPASLADMLSDKDMDLLKNPGSHLHEANIKCADGDSRDFLFNETTFLGSDGNVIGICGVMSDITDMKLAEEELTRARQKEINIGFEIQNRLLLGRPPEGLSGAKIAALSLPSQQIDGDFYDFVKYDSEHFDLMLGDVMGKGVSAALLGAATKTQLLRAIGNLVCSTNLATLPTPEEIMDFIHEEMCEKLMTLNSFATLCLARFTLDKNRMDLVDAGHTETIHYKNRTGTCNLLKSQNLPLGFDLTEKYEQISVHFEPGDILLFYSDGLVETTNANGERFSTDRVAQFVQTHASLDPSELIKELYGELVRFATSVTFSDDLTYIAVKIEPRSHNKILKREQKQITSNLSELSAVRLFLKNVLEGITQLDVKFMSMLELATSEATSNIIKHAYQDDANKFIDIEVTIYDDRIVVCLYHWGESLKKFQMMTPTFDGSQENGFGLYFIRKCVDEVHYSTDDDGLTCVRLVKQIKKTNIPPSDSQDPNY